MSPSRFCLLATFLALLVPALLLAEKDGMYLLPARLEVGESGPLHDTSKERGCYVEVLSIESENEAVVAFVSPNGRSKLLLRGFPTKDWADGKQLTDLHKYQYTVPETKKTSYGTLYVLQKNK